VLEFQNDDMQQEMFPEFWVLRSFSLSPFPLRIGIVLFSFLVKPIALTLSLFVVTYCEIHEAEGPVSVHRAHSVNTSFVQFTDFMSIFMEFT
jgi:hypothetical protein